LLQFILDLFFWNLVVNANALEVLQRNELNDQSPWKRNKSECQAEEVLVSIKSMTLSNNSTNLNHTDLCNPLNDPDNNESSVAEEV